MNVNRAAPTVRMSLAPCPFCGSLACVFHDTRAQHKTYHYWYVGCADDDCGATGPHADTEPEAVLHWNERAVA